MTKRSKAEEAESIAVRCRAVAEFISKVSAEVFIAPELEDGIALALKRHDVRGLRVVYRDLLEWAKGLADDDQLKLDELLRLQFGESLHDEERGDAKAIARVVKRGVIENEDEHRLLLKRVEEIYEDHSKKHELRKLNRLLAAYDGRGKT